ncbi:MAG: protein-export chaperone SecB [Cetobacterium sp.]|uniref:protein-export chaperone SecB n=1 Tax=Cetobacterium sp. TaxID=2071632 RepID=UPI003EE5C1C8
MKNSFFQLKEQSIQNIEFIKNENYKEKEILLEYYSETEVIYTASNEAIVVLDFSVFDKENISKHPFYINVKIKGNFVWNESKDNNDIIETLLNQNAPAILLSYVRSMISQITAFSGYPTLIVPLMNFASKE